jgi:WD40 repeat protein
MSIPSFLTLIRFGTLAISVLIFAGALAPSNGAADEPRPKPAILATLRGHTEIVYAVAFSPDGRSVLTGSFDKSLKLWDTATGKELRTLDGSTGHQEIILSVAFSPDGRTFASGSSDKTAKVWEAVASSPAKAGAANGQKGNAPPAGQPAANAPVKNFPHPNLVDVVVFAPAGGLLATGGHDGMLRIWDVAKGQQVREIKAHVTPAASPIYCLAWSPNGKQLVSGSLDRTIKLWDAGSGALVREFKAYKEKEFEKGHRDGVFAVAFSPDGKQVASGGSDRLLKLWDVATGQVVREFVNPALKKPAPPSTPAEPPPAHPGWIYSLRFTPEGARLISGGNAPRNQGYLTVWSVADGRPLYGAELALGTIYCLAISHDGKRLALACGPRDRQAPEANAYLLAVPEAGTRQAAQAKPATGVAGVGSARAPR